MQHSMQHASVGDHRQMGPAVTGRQVPVVAGRHPLMTKHLRAGPAVRTCCGHWADPENLLNDDWCRGLSAKRAQHCRAPTGTLRVAGSVVCSSAMGRTRGLLSTVQRCGWRAACDFHDSVRAVVGPVTTQCSPWSCTLQPRGGCQREAHVRCISFAASDWDRHLGWDGTLPCLTAAGARGAAHTRSG